MSTFQEIDASALQSMLAASPRPLLVDVRTPDETARGVIEGSLLLPLHLLPIHADELEGDTPLVFYCHSGIRSAQAGSFMAGRGREHVYNLRGGVLAWGMAGYALQPPPQE